MRFSEVLMSCILQVQGMSVTKQHDIWYEADPQVLLPGFLKLLDLGIRKIATNDVGVIGWSRIVDEDTSMLRHQDLELLHRNETGTCL